MGARGVSAEDLESENERLRSQLRRLELEKIELEAEIALARPQMEELKRKINVRHSAY